MTDRHNYPASVAEIIDDHMKFRPATLAAVTRFKATDPWHGSLADKIHKFSKLHQDLCSIYGKQTALQIGTIDGSFSGMSSYNRGDDSITMRGRLSVLTYLHEFSHAIGRDERGACRWSVNLFKRCFPDQFARCRQDGHTLRRPGCPRMGEGP